MDDSNILANRKNQTMLHVFYVHSGLAYLCCEQIRAAEQLAHEDCIFLQDRDIRLPQDIAKVIPWPPELQFHNFFLRKRFWANWKPVLHFDRFLNRITGKQNFTVYLPQTRYYLYQLFTTHPLCRSYNYYEEGSTACRPLATLNRELPRPRAARSLLGYLNYFGRASVYSSFCDDGADKVYSLHDMAFPDWEANKVVLKPQRDTIPAFASYAGQFDGSWLIIFDTAVESGRTKMEQYSTALGEAITALQHEGKPGPVYAKFHPAQDPGNKPELRAVLDRSFGENGYSLLDSSDNVEAILLQNSDVSVITAMCSVGFYAHLWGNRVYSFGHRLIHSDPGFASSFEEAPVQYRDVMIQV